MKLSIEARLDAAQIIFYLLAVTSGFITFFSTKRFPQMAALVCTIVFFGLNTLVRIGKWVYINIVQSKDP